MKEFYLEELKVGARFGSSAHTVTQDEIIAFGKDFDPQSFHLDPGAAKSSVFKGLAASGWHTAAITMRLMVAGELQFSGGHVGLGIDELRWPLAVRPGDTLKVEREIVELRASKSKPDRGIVRVRNVTRNQRGEVVQTMVSTQLVLRRKAGGP